MKESREEKGYSRVTCRVITKSKGFHVIASKDIDVNLFQKGIVSIDIIGSILWHGIKLSSSVVAYDHTIKITTIDLDVRRVLQSLYRL